jgi:hypothetical protein
MTPATLAVPLSTLSGVPRAPTRVVFPTAWTLSTQSAHPPNVPGLLYLLETWACFQLHWTRRNRRRFPLATFFFHFSNLPMFGHSSYLISFSSITGERRGWLMEMDTAPASCYSADYSSVPTCPHFRYFLKFNKSIWNSQEPYLIGTGTTLYVMHFVHLPKLLFFFFTMCVIISYIYFFPRFPRLLRKYFHSQSYQSHMREWNQVIWEAK